MQNSPTDRPLSTHRSRYGQLVDALRFLDFRVLWASTLCNQLGQGMLQVLLGWLVFDMTGSGALVGAVFAVRSGPSLVAGFAAGSISDRMDRRTVMRMAGCGTTLVAVAMALLLYTDRVAVWNLVLASFLFGTLQAFYMTARQAFVYDIVGARGVINGIALLSLAQRVGGVLGALLSGVLIQWLGPATGAAAMGASYGLGFIGMYGLRHRGDAAPRVTEPMLQNLRHYLTALRTNRLLLSLMLTTAAAETLGFSHQILLPILAKDILHVGATGLGVLTAFRFLGGALAVFVVTALGQVRRRGLLMLMVLALFGAGEVMLSQSTAFWMAVVFLIFTNMMASVQEILHHTLLQLSVPDEQRGRAMGAYMVGIGTAPVGQLEIGYLAGATTVRVALLANGLGLAALALVLGVILPRLRRL